jgi:predicted nucleic acid-binding protein
MLHELFQLEVPESMVRDEVMDKGYVDPEQFQQLNYTPVKIESRSNLQVYGEILQRYRKLSPYDAELPPLGLERGAICASNDKWVRKVCQELCVTAVGSIGILCCAYENQVITIEEMLEGIQFHYREGSARISLNVIELVAEIYDVHIDT